MSYPLQPISIDGIKYPSMREASRKIGVGCDTIRRKCDSDEWDTYIRLPKLEIPEDHKRCYWCKEIKHKDQFYKNKSKYDGLTSSCKQCTPLIREHVTKNNPDMIRRSKLKAAYNISLEEYNSMFSYQEGKCAICDKHQSEFKHRFCVDHDHITGQIRGLLCHTCNRALGLLKDNVDNLLRAIDYLKEDNEDI